MPPRHFLPSAGDDDEGKQPTGKTFKSVKWKWLQEYEKEKEMEEQRAREEKEKQEREEAERKAREEAERAAKEEAERKAKAEAEARAREEAERAAREAAEAREREEVERKARVEAERRATQEAAARKAKEEAERRQAEEKARRALPGPSRELSVRGPLPLDDDDDLVVLSRPEPRAEAPRKAAVPSTARGGARRQLATHASSSSHSDPTRKGALPAAQEGSRLRGRPVGEGAAGEAGPSGTGVQDGGDAAAAERDKQWGGPPEAGRARPRAPARGEQLARPGSRAADDDPSRSNQQDSTATKAGTTPQRPPAPGGHQAGGRSPADGELADSDEEETLMFTRRRPHPPHAGAADHSPSRKVARRDAAAASARRMVVEDVQSSEELPPNRHTALVRTGSQQGSKGHRSSGDAQGLGRHGSSTQGGHERGKDLGKSNLGRAPAAEPSVAAAGSSAMPASKGEPRVKQEATAEAAAGPGAAVNQESAAFPAKPSPDNDGSVGRATKRLRAEDGPAADRAALRTNTSWESKQPSHIKVEAEATSSQAGHSTSATVECYLEEGSSYNSQEVDMTWMQNFKDLWQGLRRVFPATLPDKLHAKLVYLDHDGDWIMVYPEHTRWSTFRAEATKIMVSRKT